MSPSPSAERVILNPFGPLVGQPLDDHEVDIAEINSEAFASCQRLVKEVAAGGFSAALTVFGDWGTGKTHLVGRVRRWLETAIGQSLRLHSHGNLSCGHLEALPPVHSACAIAQ
jgi:hypothetical protein